MANGRIDDVVDLARIDAQFQRMFLLMDEAIRRINQLNQLGANINLGGGNSTNQTNQAINASNQLQRAMERLAMAESAVGQQIAVINERTRQQNLVNAQNARQNIAAAGSLNDLRSRLAQASREFDNMTAAERRNSAQGGATIRNIQALQREVRELEQQTGRFQRNVGNYPQAVVGGVTGLLGTFGVALGAGAIAKQVFDTTVSLDSLNLALRAVSGSEQEFQKNQAFLVETSDRLGLNIIDLTQSYKLFYAASTQAGLSADQTRKIFDSVAQTTSTLKLSSEDTQGVLLAFSQILGKGKVQAEELRGQIGERVPGAFAIAAKAIGVTQQELDKMLQRGELIASDFLPKFANELQNTFGTAPGKVHGLQASINRLSNAFTDLVSDNQSGLSKFFSVIVEGATTAIKVVGGLTDAFQYFVNSTLDPAKNKKFIDDAAFEKVKNDIKEIDTNTVLERLSFINKNIKTTVDLLNDQQIAAKQAFKDLSGGGDTQGKLKIYAGYEQAINDTLVKLNELRRTQKIFQNEVDSRLPGKAPESSDQSKQLTEAQIKQASRLRELQLKAALEANKIDLQAAIDSQKEIFDNEKFSQYERLNALDIYNRLRLLLVHTTSDDEKRILKENIIQKQAVAEQSLVIDRKTAAEELQISWDTQKKQDQIVKSGSDKAIAALAAASERRKLKLEKDSQAEITSAQERYKAGILSEEQYQMLINQIQNKYAVLSLQEEAQYAQDLINIRKARGENVANDENKLLDIQNKISKAGIDFFTKDEKQKTKTAEEEAKARLRIQEEFNRRYSDLSRALSEFIFSMVDAQYQKRLSAIDAEIEQVNKRKDADIAALNTVSMSEQEKADRTAIINIRAQQQQDQLNNRKKQIEMQQARFEKAKSAASIVQNTASAIIKTFTEFPYPVALPISLIIGATGAAELATVLATPLPKYRDGRISGPAEWAITGDGGQQEVIESRYGTFVTPDRDTLTFVPDGARIYPSIKEYQRNAAAPRRLPEMAAHAPGKYSIDNSGAIIRAIENNKQTVIVKNTWAGVQTSILNASGQVDYLGKNVYS